ncbi:hypothetical protein [Phenylobacterium sp.]|uniref:hypothetical protein n=1 Tax=Phenylobacterium sp. TaxID=1871053 RepID=UPI002730E604|nr:hypothetical protein [Phenylobacterium sp.]MDP1616934.1 hypothetical protein [Phenylobacterium sp.]MDP1986640.1 hypothetical protein [Phenylobacterium sp.]
MRTRSIFGLSAALVIAAACAHQTTETRADMSWALNQTQSEGLKLVYGEPRSDNVLVMLSCQPQSGQVEIAITTSDDATGDVGLTSRQQRVELTSPVAPTPIAGVGVVMEMAASTTPTLAAFAQTGDLEVRTAGRTVGAPARGEDRAMVDDFFGQCGQPV